MFGKLVIIASLALAALARPDDLPSYGYVEPTHASTGYDYSAPSSPAKYDSNYAVKDDYSGNDFGHQESRDGYNTQGSYYVQLPDGRLQKVTYYVNGDSGYVAEVTYEGEAQSYGPPSNTYGQPSNSYEEPSNSNGQPSH